MLKITKILDIIKWLGFFSNFLHSKIGIRKTPLVCIIRIRKILDAFILAVAEKRYFLEENRLVKAELIMWVLFTYLLCKEDNLNIFPKEIYIKDII